ncbi:ATP-binding protein [Paenibacillus sedimenti]|uniref:ATP-binding protein n=1 Tax=Paenibacillus sedimenti TaxID=2770274 RepID=A0A926KUT8_9BACL|nr:ATP-binding protein [Paenibacillus sedimenti]MBD0383271.1 ATP-binding protein [Paenibacillus sedimenti]
MAISNLAYEGFLAKLGRPIGQVIFDGNGPNLSDARMRIRPKYTTTFGRMVVIPTTDENGRIVVILGRVDNVKDVNPHEDALSSTVSDVIPFETKYSPEGQSTIIYRVAELELLEEAIVSNIGEVLEVHSVESLPRAGLYVFEAPSEIVAPSLGLEKDETFGINIGKVRGTAVTAILKRNIIQRHIFIGGGIGTGKSYTRGVLAEELASLGVPQINIDVQGEMIEATQELGGINLQPGKDGFTLPLSALTGEDIINAIPAINRGTNIETLVKYAHEVLVKQKTLALGVHFDVDDLCRKIEELAPDLDMKANTYKPASLRAESLSKVPYIGEPFSWENEIRPGRIINIDCRGLLVTDLRLIVASIARDLQRLAKEKKIPFTMLSIDEFHLVAPKDDSSITTQVLREIARIGRHYRLGLILTTQSPADVDTSVLKRLLTRFLHAIEPDQLNALRGVFSDASDYLIKGLPKMPVGTCIITGAAETIKHATVVNIRKRNTTHGGATPDIWSDFEKRGWTKKRNLEVERRDVNGPESY